MYQLDIDKVLCKKCNGKGYYLIGKDEIACPECHPYNPRQFKHVNGTIKPDDVQYFTNARQTETRELGDTYKRMVFINQGKFLLQRGNTNVYVIWSCCDRCNSGLDPDWDPITNVFSCSVCHEPV